MKSIYFIFSLDWHIQATITYFFYLFAGSSEAVYSFGIKDYTKETESLKYPKYIIIVNYSVIIHYLLLDY